MFGPGGGAEGLTILGGSAFYLNGLPAYAELSGTMTDLYSLFPAGKKRIAFDDGFLVRPSASAALGITAAPVPEPATWASLLVGLAWLSACACRRRRPRQCPVSRL